MEPFCYFSSPEPRGAYRINRLCCPSSSSIVDVHPHFQITFLKTLGHSCTQISYVTSRGCGERKFSQMIMVTWPAWLPFPYLVKTLKTIFFRSNWPMALKLGVQHWVDHLGFFVGKSDNYLFFGNYCSLRSQRWYKHSTEWVNGVIRVSKDKVILDIGQTSLRFKN